MNTFIKKNMNIILAIFLLLGPLVDLLTGIGLHYFQVNITIGIIIRVLFLIFIMTIVIFIYKKKKLIIPYLIIGLYFIFYIVGVLIYKDGNHLFQEIQSLIKVFYFPIVFLSLYAIKEEIRTSKLTFFTVLFLYLIFLFVPISLGIGYKTYEITKVGTLGFFNSANEIGGIISILTPILFLVLATSKNIIPKVLFAIMYLVVILMVGTKTPLLALGVTVVFSLIYFWVFSIMKKKYKNIIISILVVIVGVTGMILVLPKTNFYKNIQTHLEFLEVDSIMDIFKEEELIDHFFFSQRLTFLHDKALEYKTSNSYLKMFGIGYFTNNGEKVKMIEMDYFDIYYSHGLIGFLILILPVLYMVYKILEEGKKMTFERYMQDISLALIAFLSFMTGHIITSPAVSYIVILLILALNNHKQLSIIWMSPTQEIKKKETEKYKITIREEKTQNPIKFLIFKILNYQNYDICIYQYDENKTNTKIASWIADRKIIYIEKTVSLGKNNLRAFDKIIWKNKTVEKKVLGKEKALENSKIMDIEKMNLKEIIE